MKPLPPGVSQRSRWRSTAERLASGRAGGIAAAGLLLLITLLYFWPFVLRGEIIAPTDLLLRYPPWSVIAPEGFVEKNILRGDVVDSYIPSLKQIKDAVSEGDLPLWTPLMSQGRPLAATLNNTFFHPLTLVFVTLLPLDMGFSLLVLAKLFLAGLFMYLFLRKWDVSWAGSVLGGLAFMFCGFNIAWLMWPQTLVSAFAPLLFLQTENLVRAPRPSTVALLAVAVALMVLGGFPSVTGYFFYAVALYFLVRVAQLFFNDRDWKRAVVTCGSFGASFLLGVAVTGIALLPTLEYTDYVDIGYRESLANVGLELKYGILLFFPNFFGNQVFRNFDFSLHPNLNESSGYIGLAPLTLAGAGALAGLLRHRVVVLFFAALAVACILIIYDIGPALEFVGHFPVFDLNPNMRLLSVLGFAGAAVAGFGFDELWQFRPNMAQRRALTLTAAVTAVVMAGLLGYLAVEIAQRRDFVSDFIDGFPAMEFHTFRLATMAFGLAIALALAVVVLLHLRRPLPLPVFASLLVVLTAFDLLVFAYRQNPTVADEYFYPETPAIRFLENTQKPYERMAPFHTSFKAPTGPQLYYGLNSSFNHALHDERQRTLIYSFSEGAFSSRTSLAPSSRATNFSSPLIDLLGIRFVTMPDRIDLFEMYPGLQQTYKLVYFRRGELRIYENLDYRPAFLAPDVTFLRESDTVLERMRAGFDPDEEAFVEEPPPDGFGGMDGERAPAGSEKIKVVEYEPDSLGYEVNASRPSLLIIPELYYPGWQASVDGEPVKIYRTDYILRGVFVEEGPHRVEFSYEPASFRNGLILTVLALAAVSGMLAGEVLWHRRKKALPSNQRRRNPPTPVS